MDAKLIPVAGVEAIDAVSLQPAHPVVLGSGAGCAVRLTDGKVSRFHCSIAYENGSYTVEDLDSANGTWVNDCRVPMAILCHNDRITIGGAEFRFVLGRVRLLIELAVERGLLRQARARSLLTRLEALPSEQRTVQWLVDQGRLTRAQVGELQSLLNAADAAALVAPRLLANWSFGSYRIIRELGRGKTGVVYEAEDERLGLRVALKVMRPGSLRTRQHTLRFVRGAQVLASLDHPGIAAAYEFGMLDCLFYLCMELVAGTTLDRYCAEQSPSVREKLGLVQRVSEAVAYAHQQNVIHGSLKPRHILVQPDGQPKVLDFARAKLTELPQDDELRALTMDGEGMGAVAYTAPEQTLGGAGEIDTRTDVYSLGVILYEVLTGQVPYDIEGADAAETMRLVREEEPTPPSAIAPAVDAGVERILLKALAKDKERRYQSADALSADIARYLAGEAI